MNQDTARTLGDASVGVATSSQLVAFLEAHHSLFSLGIGFCGLVLAGVFYYLNYRLRRREFELKRSKLEHESDAM